ncbi:hypothetical protein RF11_10446 [Thelohanellus kitauei]|uniref:UBR-type domain-containing protein n=1 Tax=Thelohanellus kitauei TaxID=669202 RepID=A0A0C2NMB7_THEKT|nr:hypothetical protein RF11_10446 [Thelohanellus kitauei]
MEEIKRRIDKIIIYGLVITSNDKGKNINQIYSEARLQKIVGDSLEQFVFEGFGLDIMEWFNSDEGNVERCTNVNLEGDPFYLCEDMDSQEELFICYDCFLHSGNLNHQYIPCESTNIEMSCGCGSLNTSECHATCSKHFKTYGSEVLPETFLNKFSYIIQYCCELLAELCTNDHSVLDNHMEAMLEAYVGLVGLNATSNIFNNRKITSLNHAIDFNARKSCLIVLNDDIHDLGEFIECFSETLNICRQSAQAAERDMYEHGYACIRYLFDAAGCQRAKESIEQLPVTSQKFIDSILCGSRRF